MILHLAEAALKHKIGVIPPVRFITYLTTWRCNCKCRFCDIWEKQRNYEDELNLDEIISIFSQFKNLDVIRVSGGEPFLRKDLKEIINELIKHCNPKMIHITTNGLQTNKIISDILGLEKPQRLHIKVSIDVIGKDHDDNRGVPGVFEKAMNTVKELSKIAKSTGMLVGVNQSILDGSQIGSFDQLRSLVQDLGVQIYPQIAVKSNSHLYSDNKQIFDSKLEPLGNFSKEDLEKLFLDFAAYSKENSNFAEKVSRHYFHKGYINRAFHGKKSPNPKCVALSSHLRILPNGDIPICYHAGRVVGNLRKSTWREMQSSEKMKGARNLVRSCSGCWILCEVVPNAAYTGDLIRGLY